MKIFINYSTRKKFHRNVISLIKKISITSSIHCFKYVTNNRLHILERITWSIVILSGIFGAIHISFLQLHRFEENPTVMSLERDYRTWNSTLPAATLCYHDHMDSFLATEFIQDTWNIGLTDDEYFYFMEFLYAVVNATIENYSDLANFAEDERFENLDLFEIALKIEKPFDQIIKSYSSNTIIKIYKVMTEKGVCFAFNSPYSEILTNRKQFIDKNNKPLSCQYGKQQCFLRMEITESASFISIHSPYDVFSYKSEYTEIEKSNEIIIKYKAMETVASDSVRELNEDQRKCVFPDENSIELPIYSKTLCYMKCRAIKALEICDCVPFFYPFVDGPSCNPTGFECLSDLKWPEWELEDCNCPQTCTEIEYRIDSFLRRKWSFSKKIFFQPKSSFRWELLPPKVRTRRNVIFSFEDLLVSFGGAVALFVGFSMWSMIKSFYVVLEPLLNTLINYMLYKLKAY